MKKFKKGAALVLSLAMVMGMTACGSSTSSSAAEATGSEPAASTAENATGTSNGAAIKLGGIGPLTGAAAIYGNATKYGTELAVEEINALGGIQFEIKWEDDEHDPEKSVNAYNNLKDWGMQMLVGTTTTAPCVAVSAETNSDHMFELTPSASSTDVIGVDDARKDNVFQMCFTDPNQGTASAQYISEKKLGTKIAVIYNNSDAYSTGIYNKFAAEAEKLGLEIVSATTFTDDTANDFSVQLGEAKSAGADLIFLPIYYTPASLILKQAKDMGYDPKFFGVDGMDGILDLEGFDTSLAEGLMLMTPFNAWGEDERTVKFVSEYQALADGIPNQFAADGYDCIYAIYQACQQAGVTADMGPQEVCEKLTKVFTDGSFAVDGLTGSGMHWQTNGEVSKDPVVVKVESGKYVTQ